MKASYSAANYVWQESSRVCTDLLHISMTWKLAREIMKITIQQLLILYLKVVTVLICSTALHRTLAAL